jgi:hypothetical protein
MHSCRSSGESHITTEKQCLSIENIANHEIDGKSSKCPGELCVSACNSGTFPPTRAPSPFLCGKAAKLHMGKANDFNL